MTSAEIGNIGERHAEAWLQSNGYACNRNTQLPGSTDIEADHSAARLLVQVKTAMSPSWPADLSADEVRNITSRAANSQRQAWAAKVVITSNGQLANQIAWLRLN